MNSGKPSVTASAGAVSGSFGERVVRVSSPNHALTVSAVYRAIELRAKTEAQFQLQYQRRNTAGGNFVPDMYGRGAKLNYLLQVQPNPLMTASALITQVVIRRLTHGNALVYIERDYTGDPVNLWLANTGGYNEATGTYSLSYLADGGIKTIPAAAREDVLHFANTYRDMNGFWGISTLRFAFDTLSLIKTEHRQALDTTAKGGRMKLIIGEEKQQGNMGILAGGLYNKKQMEDYAREVQQNLYDNDVLALRGLEKVQNISMSAQDMQLIEQLNLGMDDVARFFGTPRSLLMLDSNSHYTTPTNTTLEYMTRTIQPDIQEMEQEFNRKLLHPDDFDRRRFHMCEQPLLRLDKEAQAKVDQLRLQTGSATVNEIRKQYDMPAVEKGDIVYVSTNLAELGSEKLSASSAASATNNQTKQL